MTQTTHAALPSAEARRQQIVDAASACARRSGFHGASMAQIAQEADMSVGQIYRYFENKEAIIGAIVARDMAEMRDKFATLEAAGGPHADAIVDGCAQALVDSYDADRSALMLAVLAEAARHPDVADILRHADAAELAFRYRDLPHIRHAAGPQG